MPYAALEYCNVYLTYTSISHFIDILAVWGPNSNKIQQLNEHIKTISTNKQTNKAKTNSMHKKFCRKYV